MSGLRYTNGVTIVTVHDPPSGWVGQMHYRPETPEISSVEETSFLMDGGQVRNSTHVNVTETVEVFLSGGDSVVRAIKTQLELLFEEARRFQNAQEGNRVYVEFRPNDTDSWWRSELFTGRVVLSDNVLDSHMLPSGDLILTIHHHRQFHWEGPESYLSLTNGNGTSSAGLAIGNANDASRDNWVSINGAAILGDLPAPVRLEITNTTNDSSRTGSLLIGHSSNVAVSPSHLLLEGENGTTSYGSTISDTAYSNGAAKNLSWTGSGETQLLRWTLSSAQLSALAGGYFRAVMGILNPNYKLQLRILFELSELWRSEWMTMPTVGVSSLQELATTKLPPYLTRGLSVYPLYLDLYAKNPNWISGSNALVVDFLHWMPLASWRRLVSTGYQLAYGARLVVDEVEGFVYTDGWSQAGAAGNYVAYGSPIMLIPGKTAHLYFLADSATGAYTAARSHSVRLAYRPRRKTI